MRRAISDGMSVPTLFTGRWQDDAMNSPSILSVVTLRSRADRQATGLLIVAAPVLMGLHALASTSASALAVSLIVAALVVGIVQRRCPRPRDGLGRANRVTLIRSFIVALLAGFLLTPSVFVAHGVWLAGLVLLGLCLDGLDGYLARRYGEVTAFGARFDMEVDAALLLVVSAALAVSGQFGPWVLAIGLMRYLFVAAGCVLRWIDRPLPERFRRKLVCVLQVGALTAALLPMLPMSLRTGALAIALLALIASFGADLRWLFRQRGRVDQHVIHSGKLESS